MISDAPASQDQQQKSSEVRSTVFIVDDDPDIRESLQWLIESVGLDVKTFSSANEFLEQYDPEAAGCLVLDVRMPGISGLDLQEMLRKRGCELPIIIVTGYADVPMAVRALKNGALEFLQKPYSEQLLLEHVQRAILRDAENRDAINRRQVLLRRLESLTRREREVLDFVVEGLSSKEIAERLDISFKTVETHRAKIMKKMQAKNVPHLIRMYVDAQSHLD